MSEFPLVSVVTLTYNKFDNIYRTIDSVLNQTYPKIELIIHDDCSKQFPYEEIFTYIKKNKKNNLINFLVHSNDRNVGTVKNINMAYKKTNGTYIFNLAGDDIFYKNTVIDDIVKVFNKENCGMLVTSRLGCDENLAPLRLYPYKSARKSIAKLNTNKKQYLALLTYEFYQMASGSATYFKKSLLEEIGYFDENYILWEDYPIYLKYTWKKQIFFAYDIISIYYVHGGVSNSKKVNPLMEQDHETMKKLEWKRHYSELNKKEQNIVDYMIKKRNAANLLQRIGVLLKYPIVDFSHIFYKAKMEYFKKVDEHHHFQYVQK